MAKPGRCHSRWSNFSTCFVTCLGLLIFVNLVAAAGKSVREQFVQLVQAGIAAYDRKDYAASVESLQKAIALVPEAPRANYRLAGALALLGRKDEALRALEKAVAAGVALEVGENADFAALRGDPRFEQILKRCDAARQPQGAAVTAFVVKEKDLIPEGIAHDSVTGCFYLSSLYKRKIVEVRPDGTAHDFTTEAQDGFWCGLGMKVDAGRRVLWAANTAEEAMRDFKQEVYGRAAVHKYDLQTGKLISKYDLPNQPEPHILNDLALTAEGDLYITDTLTGAVYLIDHARDTLEIFIEAGRFSGANGIALSDDEKKIFVACDFGIGVVDRATRSSFLLPPPAEATLTGIDGLYWHKRSLIAVQTDIRRIQRFHLSASLDRVERVEVLDSWNPLFGFPTTGVVVGEELFYIADAQYASYNQDGTLFPLEKLKEVIVLKVPLA